MDSDDMDDQNAENNRDSDKENVTSNNHTKVSEKPKRKKKSKRLFSWFFWMVFAVVFFSAFNIIQEGFVGISQRLGKMQAVLSPGFHAKLPFIDSVELLETRIRIVELESQATNADHIEVKLKLTANWHLPASSATIFYKKQGNVKQYEERVLIPLLRSVSHGLISQYTTSELLDKRSVINELMSTAIFNSSQLMPAILDSVQIEKFSLPESYQKGLEKKLTEEQVLEAEQLKASKGKIKAQADSDIAEIKANALIKQAEATAQAMLIKGEAKATVIKKIISAIKENRQYVEYEKIQKWDGRLSSSNANLNEIFKSVEK
jgi:regulator of protease activity HflC (stomatin/prohibitin superfamily)